MADAPRPSLIGWILGVAFAGVPTLVLAILGVGFSGSGEATLARLDAAQRGESKEKLVTGTAQARAGVEVLTAPASDQPCLAWDTTVSVAWPEEDSSGREETQSRALKSGARAVAFEVRNDLGDAIALVDEPALDLQGQPQVRDYGAEPPPWTDSLSPGERAADSTHARRWYRSWELTLMPGATVTLLGVPDADDPKRLRPSEAGKGLFVMQGTPRQLRSDATTFAVVGTWLTRTSFVSGGLTLLFAAGLVRAVLRRRRS